MTKKEAAIISAYTGILIGAFSDMQAYIEKLFKRPIWPYEMANKEFSEKIKNKSRQDFLSITVRG